MTAGLAFQGLAFQAQKAPIGTPSSTARSAIFRMTDSLNFDPERQTPPQISNKCASPFNIDGPTTNPIFSCLHATTQHPITENRDSQQTPEDLTSDFLETAKHLRNSFTLAGHLMAWMITASETESYGHEAWIRYIETSDMPIDGERHHGQRMFVNEIPAFLSWFTSTYGATGWEDFIAGVSRGEPTYSKLLAHPFINSRKIDTP